ncbi:MAG TPA: type I-E CRISPR-associated protein Cas7/Cse4/CasC, partial [Plasticicumulans sp.]|nr:type I-E CRISPR-associated protein Cas7/Cse4/CasC [Plasticicumulans sp.]
SGVRIHDAIERHDEDAGAGHVGEAEFGAAVFYLYLCVDRELLCENLGGDRALTDRALAALVEAATKVAPTGKQNSFASRARASYALLEKGDEQPRQLSVAFLKPVTGSDPLADAIDLLRATRAKMDQVYGPCAAAVAELDALAGTGNLAELQAFAAGD